jgi:hypothetical protein
MSKKNMALAVTVLNVHPRRAVDVAFNPPQLSSTKTLPPNGEPVSGPKAANDVLPDVKDG